LFQPPESEQLQVDGEHFHDCFPELSTLFDQGGKLRGQGFWHDLNAFSSGQTVAQSPHGVAGCIGAVARGLAAAPVCDGQAPTQHVLGQREPANQPILALPQERSSLILGGKIPYLCHGYHSELWWVRP
jgi:hypothetical protein